jgi:ATP-dependent protease Clp ATPase subunit
MSDEKNIKKGFGMLSQIVGQDALVKDLSKIFTIFTTSKGEITPHFILAGTSGSGKTHTINTLCDEFDMNFIEINAASLTKEGTSGNSLSKALSPLAHFKGKLTIVFVDEFDKLFISSNSNSSLAHETTMGVQNEFLKVLESKTTSVFGDYGKYLDVDVSKCLFVFAGAFNNEEHVTLDKLRTYGVKTEFLGRVGLIYNANVLTLDHLQIILERSPLLSMYLSIFDSVDKSDVVATIKDFLIKNYEHNDIGARLVNTLIHQYFIKGGELGIEDVKEVSFQKKLSLK